MNLNGYQMENNGEYYTQELLLMPGYSFVMLDGAHVLEDSFMTGQAIRIANALNSAVNRTSRVVGLLLTGEQSDPTGTIKVELELGDGTLVNAIETCANSIYHWVSLSNEHIDIMKSTQN
jgi:2-keto-3-deoxy-L-rhamnonate aldolase RhmA